MEYFESEIPKAVGRRPPEKTRLAGHGGTPLDRTINKQIESLTTDELLAWISNSLTVSCMFGFMAGMVLAFSLTHLNSNHSAFDFAAVISALFLLGPSICYKSGNSRDPKEISERETLKSKGKNEMTAENQEQSKTENDNVQPTDSVAAEINRAYQERNELWSRNWCPFCGKSDCKSKTHFLKLYTLPMSSLPPKLLFLMRVVPFGILLLLIIGGKFLYLMFTNN